MKTCPFCDTDNGDDAFYCSKCEKPFSETQDDGGSSASAGGFGLSLVEDAPPEKTPAAPAAQRVENRPAAEGARAPQQRMSTPQQPVPRRAGPGLFSIFLAVLVLLLVSAIAYLILEQEALTKKSDFSDRIAKVSEHYSSQIKALDEEIQNLRSRRDQLVSDLAVAEERYKRDTALLRNRLQEHVKGRIPGAQLLTFSEVTAVHKQGAKYIIAFSRDDLTQEVLRYKITLENAQETPLIPSAFDLIVFNEDGLQIGSSSVAFLDHLALKHIPPGEARVTLGSIRLISHGKPTFFIIYSGQ